MLHHRSRGRSTPRWKLRRPSLRNGRRWRFGKERKSTPRPTRPVSRGRTTAEARSPSSRFVRPTPVPTSANCRAICRSFSSGRRRVRARPHRSAVVAGCLLHDGSTGGDRHGWRFRQGVPHVRRSRGMMKPYQARRMADRAIPSCTASANSLRESCSISGEGARDQRGSSCRNGPSRWAARNTSAATNRQHQHRPGA